MLGAGVLLLTEGTVCRCYTGPLGTKYRAAVTLAVEATQLPQSEADSMPSPDAAPATDSTPLFTCASAAEAAALLCGNPYVTSLAHLHLGLCKLAQLSRSAPVYRLVDGGDFPASFWRALQAASARAAASDEGSEGSEGGGQGGGQSGGQSGGQGGGGSDRELLGRVDGIDVCCGEACRGIDPFGAGCIREYEGAHHAASLSPSCVLLEILPDIVPEGSLDSGRGGAVAPRPAHTPAGAQPHTTDRHEACHRARGLGENAAVQASAVASSSYPAYAAPPPPEPPTAELPPLALCC